MNMPFIDQEKLACAVDAIVSDYWGRGYFPSASVRVFTKDESLLETAVGDAGPKTVFDVASLTKIATATQILLLIDAGELTLGTCILDCLPALGEDALLRDRLGGVTLFALLTHTSGIVDWYPFYAEKGSFAEVFHVALARYGPVSGMVYSDLNFMLLGEALKAHFQMPLEACLRQCLVLPYGLGRMTYWPDPAWDIAPSCYGNPIEENMCRERGIAFDGFRPHTPVRGQANDGNAYYYFGGEVGSAGIFADTAAYQRLCQLYLRTDMPVLLEAQTEKAPTRGLGFQRGEMYPRGCGHTGFSGTSIYLSRLLGIGVVAFTNRLFFKEENSNPTNDFRRALHRAVAELVEA